MGGLATVGMKPKPLFFHLFNCFMPPAHRQFIYGHMAALFQFVAMLPGWARDWIMARRFGLLTPAAKYVKVD